MIGGTDKSLDAGDDDDSPDCKGDYKSMSKLETKSHINTQPYN